MVIIMPCYRNVKLCYYNSIRVLEFKLNFAYDGVL